MAGFNWGTALGSAGNAMQAYQNYQQQQLINQQNQQKLNAYMQAQALSTQITQDQLAQQKANANIAGMTWDQIQAQYGNNGPAPAAAPGQNSAQNPGPAMPPQQVQIPNAAPAPQASQAMPPQGQMSPGMQFLMGGQGGAGMAGGAQAPAVPGASPITGTGMQNAQAMQGAGAAGGGTGLLGNMPSPTNLSTPNDVIGYYNQRAQAILQNADAEKRRVAQIKPANNYEKAALLAQYNSIDAQARAAVNDLTKERDATLTAVRGNTPTAYQQKPLSMSTRSPRNYAIMERARQINPNYDDSMYATYADTNKKFAAGKEGDQVRALNVAVSHLDTLSDLSQALSTGNVQLINRLGQSWQKETGQTAPSNFDAAKRIVGQEVTKAVVSAGGGQKEREEAAAAITSANSPAQLAGVIQTYKTLLGGQLQGFRNQYAGNDPARSATFDKRYLTDRTRKALGVDTGAAQAANKPSLNEFLAKARAANPGVSDADLKKYWQQTYGGQ